MEKMNQVSVSEFMSKSKEEMYDMAVEMVKKYNRLVDICNDSAERMAEFMAKDDINEFKKELQSKAPGEFKIQKLADIVVCADGIIKDAGYNEEKYQSDGSTAYCHVKAHELWRIRDVALKSMERHTVYSNALNNDIAEKAAKIDLLEKEIEGRKEGYWALKEKYDKLEKELDDKNDKIEKQRENLDAINKTLEIRNKENDSLVKTIQSTRREIEAHEHENKRLSERIIELKEEVKKRDKCIMEKNESINTGNEAIINLRKQIGDHEEENKKLEKQVKYLEKELNDYKSWNASLHKDIEELKEFASGKVIEDLKESKEYWRTKYLATQEERDAIQKELDETIQNWVPFPAYEQTVNDLKDEIKKLKKKEDDHGRKGFEEYIKYIISEEEGKFKAELDKRLSEEVSKISQKRTEEELAKAKLNDKFGVGGIVDEFKDDIPCGEDAIE